MRKLLTFLVLIFLGVTGQAQNVVTSFSSLQWSMATNYASYSTCNRLILDATGDFVAGSSFVLSGYLDCAVTGRILAFGNGFFRPDGTVAMRVSLPNGNQIFCKVLDQLSGQCLVQDAATADLGVGVDHLSLTLKRLHWQASASRYPKRWLRPHLRWPPQTSSAGGTGRGAGRTGCIR